MFDTLENSYGRKVLNQAYRRKNSDAKRALF
jgi:hypothetical protein